MGTIDHVILDISVEHPAPLYYVELLRFAITKYYPALVDLIAEIDSILGYEQKLGIGNSVTRSLRRTLQLELGYYHPRTIEQQIHREWLKS